MEWIFAFLAFLLFAGLFYSIFKQTQRKNSSGVVKVGVGTCTFYYLILQMMTGTVSQTVYILQALCAYSKMWRKEGMFQFSLMFRPAILIFNYKAVEAVLNNNVLTEKSKEYHLLHPWLGTGLLTSDSGKWRYRRKLLTPSFHFRILENFMDVFNSKSNIMIAKLKNVVREDYIDITPFVTMCTLDVICETTMGVCIQAQEKPESFYVKSISEVSNLLFQRIVRPWLWLNEIFYLSPSGREFRKLLQGLHSFTRKVIKSKKEEMLIKMKESNTNEINQENEGPTPRRKKAFLELLLELHLKDSSFTEDDIKEEVDTFMFEGHDTTAMAVSWTLYNVGLRPDIQKKIHIEMDEILGNDKERPITIDDIKAMKYLELVIKETLRLYPSVPMFARELTEDLEIMGKTVPRGYMISILCYMLHRDPSVFPNPEYFDPDRFLPENSNGRSPFAYVPFSAGPRNCIGQKFAMMEEKTILANVFRNFEVTSLDTRDKINVTGNLILRCDGPLRLKVALR